MDNFYCTTTKTVILSEVVRALCELRSRRTPKNLTVPILSAPSQPQATEPQHLRMERFQRYR